MFQLKGFFEPSVVALAFFLGLLSPFWPCSAVFPCSSFWIGWDQRFLSGLLGLVDKHEPFQRGNPGIALKTTRTHQRERIRECERRTTRLPDGDWQALLC